MVQWSYFFFRSYQYNSSVVTTPMWLQRLLVQSLANLTAPPKNVAKFVSDLWPGLVSRENRRARIELNVTRAGCCLQNLPTSSPKALTVRDQMLLQQQKELFQSFPVPDTVWYRRSRCCADTEEPTLGSSQLSRLLPPGQSCTWRASSSYPGNAGAAQPLCSPGDDQTSREGGPGRVHLVDQLCVKCCGWVEGIKWRKPMV